MMANPAEIPVYRPSGNNIAELLMRQGDIQARRAEQTAAIWGNAINNLGQIGAQAYQQHAEQKDKARREQLLTDAMSTWDPAHPEDFYRRTAAIAGPEMALSAVRAFSALEESKRKAQPDPKLLQTKLEFMGRLWKQHPDIIKQNWPAFANAVSEVEPLTGIKVSPEWDDTYGATLDAFAPGEKQAGTKWIERLLPGGGKEMVSVEDKPNQTISAGIVPAKPENLSAEEAYIRARHGEHPTAEQMLEDRARFSAAGRAPEKPAEKPEYTLSPEGVVLSSYGVKQKDEVRRQAQERGLPVFENAATQVKGVTLRTIVEDASELKTLLGLKKVQDAIGPVAGRVTQLKAKVFDLDPDVQRAIQLMTSLSDTELRKRSGAQINEREMQRILRFATDPDRPLGHNTTAVDGILKSGARDYRALSGVDLSQGTLEETPAAPMTTLDKSALLKKHGF
jgi:hypothetical protein